jgi:predicted ribosome quality control (RQC) complex YloA/Tae2 family protein
MQKITFDLRKTVNDNASTYYEKSKKLKSKVDGVTETITRYEKELEKQKKIEHVEREKFETASLRKKAWYEKFRWFHTSKGTLCIGGKDSSSNEVIIKKHTDDEDIVFHTDMAGSPFFTVKATELSEEEIEEVASITACYSRAWKLGLSSTDVFYVKGEQVSKEANAGESLSKGSFMIRGKTTYARNTLILAIGVHENQVIVGSENTISKKCKKYGVIVQGDTKTSDIAKKLQKKLGGDLDDFVRVLPSGGAKVKKIA